MDELKTLFEQQHLPNGYELIDGVKMHEQFGDRFQIPNWWFRKYVGDGDFVEVRVDSNRFSTPPDHEPCDCEACGEPLSKPVLCHDEPSTLEPTPRQPLPSRGWGEQFWVLVTEREGPYLRGVIDNPLYEVHLHELQEGQTIVFTENHILAVHPVHNRDIMQRMEFADFVDFLIWLRSRRKDSPSDESGERNTGDDQGSAGDEPSTEP